MKIAPLSFVLGGLTYGMAAADELVLPQAFERGQSAEVAYRFGTPSTGHGFLDIEWSDVERRVVERRRIPASAAIAARPPSPLPTATVSNPGSAVANRCLYASSPRSSR